MTLFEQPPSQSRPFAQPLRGDGEPIRLAPESEPHLPLPEARPRLTAQGRTVWPWVWFVVGFFCLATLAFFVTTYGAVAPLLASLLAYIPLAGVVVALMWLDRWEPEPRGMLFFAAAWGAFVSVMLTLVIGTLIAGALRGVALPDWFGSVVQAPVVEEVLKCLGILFVLAMARRAFDGALDGIVYGGLIGAGFAFVENVKYFVEALAVGGIGELSAVFFLRAVLSPFAHIMFTAVCGFAVGLAVRRARGVTAPWFAGLAVAIALHAFWNGSAYVAGFFLPYVLLQMPMFALFVLAAIRIRREELQLRRERLEEYVRAGWFTSHEADILSTRHGRRAGLAWAARLPGGRRHVMESFIHDGARLAWARQRALTGRDPQAPADERALLRRMMQTRAELIAPAPANDVRRRS